MKELIRGLIPRQFRPYALAEKQVRKKTGMIVHSGVFQGMRYVDTVYWGGYAPKLLGTYERELDKVVEFVVGRSFPHVADIGAADGYFAVGFARRMPTSFVTTWEMDPAGRDVLKEMAQINGVAERMAFNGKCDPTDLCAYLEGKSDVFILCDVEGFETELLNPITCQALRSCFILVELHEFMVKGVSDLLKERFQLSHDIEHIWQEPRTALDMPFEIPIFGHMSPKTLVDLVDEQRPERMSWLWMRPRV